MDWTRCGGLVIVGTIDCTALLQVPNTLSPAEFATKVKGPEESVATSVLVPPMPTVCKLSWGEKTDTFPLVEAMNALKPSPVNEAETAPAMTKLCENPPVTVTTTTRCLPGSGSMGR